MSSGIVTAGAVAIQPEQPDAKIAFNDPPRIGVDHERYTLELWLIWIGQGPLTLVEAPTAH